MTKLSWTIGIAVTTVIIAGAAFIGIATYGPSTKSVKIGYGISLTGANALSASMTVVSNYRLWVKDVNEAGGIMLKSIGKRVPIEVIEYDDESTVEKALEVTDRLIKQDKVDFLLAPLGTGQNIAVGQLFHDAGYPQLAVNAYSDRTPELARLWPSSFWFQGTATDSAQALVVMLDKLRSKGKIGSTIAMVSVGDQFGIGIAKAARKALEKSRFDIVYDRSYAVGLQDMRQIIEEAKRASPDTFIAFSFPVDTMAITGQARILGFNPKIFYTAIGTALPQYKRRFGPDIQGVMGVGGWNPDSPEGKAYQKRHIDATGEEPDRRSGPLTYGALQMLQQAIERVGKIDRPAVIQELRTGTFQTILGDIKLDGNLYRNGWRVGQWQDGEFYGIAPATQPGAQEVLFPKPAWRAAPTD
jgi:branched-chain amino acid transport system substrate-binding protein